MFTLLQQIQRILDKLKERIKTSDSDYDAIITKISKEIADVFIDQFYDLEDEEVTNICTKTQAAVFWVLKYCPLQEKCEQEKDYFEARSYLGFLLSDFILSTCSKDGMCPLLKLKSNHLKLMQSISANEYVHDKAYLYWVKRTNKKYYSSCLEKDEDFIRANSFLHESVGLCNGCPNVSNYQYWKSICTPVRGDHEYKMLHMFRLVAEKNIDVLSDYCAYVFRYLGLIEKYFDGETDMSWREVQLLLIFVHEHPDLANLFELLMIRVLVSSCFSGYLDSLLRNSRKEKNNDEFIEAQAWLFWYMKLCPMQDYKHQLDDFYDAKRYIAFLQMDQFLDNLFYSTSFSKSWTLLTEHRIRLSQCLTIEEYCRHKINANGLNERLSHNNDVKQGLKAEVNNGSSGKISFENANDNIDISERKQIAYNILTKTKLPSVEAIKAAKYNTLARLSIATPEYIIYVNEVTESFYTDVDNLIKTKGTTNVVLPTENKKYKVAFNMFEYLIASLSTGKNIKMMLQ